MGQLLTRVLGNPDTASQTNPVIYQGVVSGTLGTVTALAPDLGLPGLGFVVDANSSVQLSTNYSFTLRFGLTNNEFFLDSSLANELAFTVTASMANGSSVMGSFGLLEATATSAAPGTQATFVYTVDINDSAGNSDGRITSDAEISQTATLQATVTANLNLDAKFSQASSPLVNPRLLSNLHLGWNFSDNLSSSILGGTTKPSVNIDQIRLDLNSFFTSLVGPLLSNIQDAAGPLFTLAEKLNQQVFPNQDAFDLTYLDVIKVGSLTVAPIHRDLLRLCHASPASGRSGER